jgi:hypothetical protein
VSVFLRWGIFGILAVAGLIYAYNASKQMAARRANAPPAPLATPSDAAAEPEARQEMPSGDEGEAEPALGATPPHCEAELVVAQRALAARAEGQPLDRLLRIQEIAFQEPVRRQRLEKVATFWFQFEGPEPHPESLRIGVISDCVRFSPAP